MPSVDLNCDVGEGVQEDTTLLSLATSANIACGAHAGTPEIMRLTTVAAMAAGVSIGAHPGYDDPEHLGRRVMHLPDERLRTLLEKQLDTLSRIVTSEGSRLVHVKPHGALYNQAAFDSGIAEVIAETVADFDATLRLVGLAGSELVAAGRRAGLAVAGEGFADRTYRSDGTLTPRDDLRALVLDPDQAARRAVRMATEGVIETIDGTKLPLQVDTICIHGDSPGAVSLATAVREALHAAGVTVEAPGPGS